MLFSAEPSYTAEQSLCERNSHESAGNFPARATRHGRTTVRIGRRNKDNNNNKVNRSADDATAKQTNRNSACRSHR